MSAAAQQVDPASETAAEGEGECFPACRDGYLCHRGECVSQCNPPCAADEVCTPEAACVPKPPVQAQQQWQQPQPQQQWQQPPQQSGGWQQGAGSQQAGWEGSQPAAPEPGPVAAPGAFRLQLTFDPGFGGKATIEFDGEEFDGGGFDPTFGMRVQGTFSLGRFVYLGLEFGLDGLIGENAPPDTDRLLVFGIGPVVGLRYAVDLGSVAIEPIAGLSIGYARATDENAVGDDGANGFGVAFRAGLNLWVSPVFGLHFNVGYQLHKFYQDPDLTLSVGQFRMGVGIAIRMGA